MADLAKLRTELTTDPLARGYAGMSDAQVITSLNTANRTITRSVIPSFEVVNAIVATEYAALTQVQRDAVQLVTGAGNVDANNSNVRAIFQNVFGAGTTTRTNLLALPTVSVSRATELGIGEVHTGDVAAARA